MVYNYIRVTQ